MVREGAARAERGDVARSVVGRARRRPAPTSPIHRKKALHRQTALDARRASWTPQS